MFKMKSAVVAAFVACWLAFSPLPACANEHQFHEPLRIVAPASPSSILDQAPTCLVTKSLSDTIQQKVIVENAPGAGGTLSIQTRLRTKPDGKTVIEGRLGPNAANYQPHQKPPYTTQDMEQVIHVPSMPHVLAASPQLDAKAIVDLKALARSQPNDLSIAVSTTDSSSNLTFKWLKSSAGVSAVDPVYRGAALALALADLTTRRQLALEQS